MVGAAQAADMIPDIWHWKWKNGYPKNHDFSKGFLGNISKQGNCAINKAVQVKSTSQIWPNIPSFTSTPINTLKSTWPAYTTSAGMPK